MVREFTSIVVAHRLSTVKNVDTIIVLHKGKLREQGTHSELLAKGGLYTKLYELATAFGDWKGEQ